MTTLTDTLRPIVAELADVLAAKGELEAQERDLKARIRQAVPGLTPTPPATPSSRCR
jgi:hypothetical protein